MGENRNAVQSLIKKHCVCVSTPLSTHERGKLRARHLHPELTKEKAFHRGQDPRRTCDILKNFWGLLQFGFQIARLHGANILHSYALGPKNSQDRQCLAQEISFDIVQLLFNLWPCDARLHAWLATDMIETCPQTQNPLVYQLTLMSFWHAREKVSRHPVSQRVCLCRALADLDLENPDRVKVFNDRRQEGHGQKRGQD